jgi:hypothetical protein
MAPPPDATGRSVKDDGSVWITKKPVNDVKHKRKLAVWVGLLTVATIAIVVWLVTSVIGFFASSSSNASGSGPTAAVTTSAKPGTTHPATAPAPPPPGAAVKPSAIAEYNAPGHNPDNPGKAKLAIDGDPATQWQTDIYLQPFPALAPGIGLMATFDQPVALAEVDIDSPSAGTVVEIRAASSANQDVKSAQLIGSATLANGHTEIKLAAMQPTRYILVWITTLAGGGSNNGSGIGEITYHQTK